MSIAPRRLTFVVRAGSTAPPHRLFALLADGATWPRWSIVRHARLEREGIPAPHGVGAIRRFGGGPFASREQVVLYEPPHRFGYALLSGLPVRDYRAEVALVPRGTGTAITWRAGFYQRLPGTGLVLRWLLCRTIHGMARGLTRYAEMQAGYDQDRSTRVGETGYTRPL